MPKAGSGVTRKKRVKNVLSHTKGFRGSRSKLHKTAKNAMFKSLSYAYVGRKQKKRNFRQLWIARINAACREAGISYSRFIAGLKKAQINIDRKNLANMAIESPESFTALIEKAKEALK